MPAKPKKLSIKDAREIVLEYYNSNLSTRDLAKSTGYSSRQIHCLVSFKYYQECDFRSLIPDEVYEKKMKSRMKDGKKKKSTSKFSDEHIRDFLYEYAESESTNNDLSDSYRIPRSYLNRIIKGELYKDVFEEIPEETKNKIKTKLKNASLHRRKRRKLTPRQVRRIRAKREEGLSVEKIAKEFGVSSGCIEKIIDRKTYRDVK